MGDALHGTFLAVKSPVKVANTENCVMDMSTFNPHAPEESGATVESRTFTTEGNGTLMTHHYRYSSVEVCKMMLETGAADGMAACYLELDKLLLKI